MVFTGQPIDDNVDPLIEANLARKASAHRELHFKSADDWLAYNERFGMFSPTESVMRAYDTAARQTALLREFGTQPRKAFEADLAYLKARHAAGDQRTDLDKWEGALRTRFDYLDGTANRPVNRTAARITSGWMAIERIAKLGLTPFSMLADLSTKASELRYQGVPFFERWSSMLSGYFKGADGTEKREVADLLLAGINGRIGDIASRFDVPDSPHGAIARAENIFFKITGITPMTENQRADSEVIMARHLGMRRGKEWASIGEAETRILRSFGIDEGEWGLLHKAEWTNVGEHTYLTPDIARKLSDEDVAAYLKARRGPASMSVTPAAIDKAREDIALKLASYFADRGEYAVLEVGMRERAILFQGTQPGTTLGTALRLMMQFKQFPTAMIVKTWGREIYGGQDRLGQVAGLAELIISSTLLGIVANALNQTVKGQDPFSRWQNEPAETILAGFIKGGMGSIYGDFLLGEWSRHGMSASGSLLGPTFGQVDSLAEIYSKAVRGEFAAASAVRTVRDHIPFGNMIYTKAALDYLILYRIQEALNPGYLKRYEKTMKEKQGTEFWLRPSQVSR